MQHGDAYHLHIGNRSSAEKRRLYLSKMESLKTQLNESRRAIDTLKMDYGSEVGSIFSECARMVNPFEQISTVAKQRVISRAHFKMAELMTRFQLLSKNFQFGSGETLQVVFLCEAPGGFVEYIGRWFSHEQLIKASEDPFSMKPKGDWKGYCIS